MPKHARNEQSTYNYRVGIFFLMSFHHTMVFNAYLGRFFWHVFDFPRTVKVLPMFYRSQKNTNKPQTRPGARFNSLPACTWPIYAFAIYIVVAMDQYTRTSRPCATLLLHLLPCFTDYCGFGRSRPHSPWFQLPQARSICLLDSIFQFKCPQHLQSKLRDHLSAHYPSKSTLFIPKSY